LLYILRDENSTLGEALIELGNLLCQMMLEIAGISSQFRVFKKELSRYYV
jgi:hypothetical protein